MKHSSSPSGENMKSTPPRGSNLRRRIPPGSGTKAALFSDTSDADTETDQDNEVNSKEVPKDSVASAPLPARAPQTMSKIATRSAAGICMIAFYCAMLRAGHFYCILVAVLTQFELFRELVNVRYQEAKERAMPLFRTLQWSWFLLSMLFVYGESLHKFCLENSSIPALYRVTLVTTHLHNILFVLYCCAFMITVLTLKNGMIRFQLSQLMWTVVTICMVVFQCKFFAGNTLNGLFWFFFPMATVVMNDISAYFCGITMGRKFIHKEFIALSPNKTWEGFIGAAVLTTAFGFFFPVFLSQYTWFTCPVHDLYIWEAPPPLVCNVNEVFLPHVYELPQVIARAFSLLPNALVAVIPGLNYAAMTFTLRPIQLHGLAYGLFASLVAPFGGFLASGIKRAYKVKDFDSIFPGHGGLMDRMDCILVMIFFTSFHFRTFIEQKTPSVGQVLTLLQLLSVEEKRTVAITLQEMLANAQ